MKELKYQSILDEIFEDEIYDICDAIPQDVICKKLHHVARQFGLGSRTVMFTLGGCLFKVVNCVGGFVSCSNAEGTGVSETQYKPFPNDADYSDKERFTNLISMMNEAWYYCNE